MFVIYGSQQGPHRRASRSAAPERAVSGTVTNRNVPPHEFRVNFLHDSKVVTICLVSALFPPKRLFVHTQFDICQPAGRPRDRRLLLPHGGATEAVVHELGNAKEEILVQAYSFTSTPIAKALVDAHKRGVKVTVVLDRSQRLQKYSSADFVNNAGIPTFIDAKHAIAHNKIMIIDGVALITGSINFTKAAEEKNAENLLVLKGDPGLVKKYLENFQEHLEHSERYEGRGGDGLTETVVSIGPGCRDTLLIPQDTIGAGTPPGCGLPPVHKTF